MTDGNAAPVVWHGLSPNRFGELRLCPFRDESGIPMRAMGAFWLVLSVCVCQCAAARSSRFSFRENEGATISSRNSSRCLRSPAPARPFRLIVPATAGFSFPRHARETERSPSFSTIRRNPTLSSDHHPTGGNPAEGVRFVKRGEHRIRVDCEGAASVDRLVVKAIPELIHSGLGFDPAIKSFGHYDMAFLEQDVLPNVTTLIVPHGIKLPQSVIDEWHRQGKRFVAEVGIDAKAKTAEAHVAYWAGLLDSARFVDGIIVNEFIINRPSPSANRRTTSTSPRRLGRAREQERYRVYNQAIKQLRADPRCKDKAIYFYFGGSGNTLNQEMIGPALIRTIRDCQYRIALERYLFERSSETRSRDALRAFVEGIADWNAKEPGVNRELIIAFGLFSMPPGGINKLPNVDYHVWMDQQMHVVANDPAMSGMAGLEWWTSLLADEETVRFVGKLYRHYAIEGKRDMLTRDPLFLTHLQNADFEHQTTGWELHPAEKGSIEPKRFPRYGRIEMRFMGQSRPADPEHIGDTFLWMRRSARGPNTFSQTIKNLEPGRLYSLEMLSCDYQDSYIQKRRKRSRPTSSLEL